MWKSLCICEMHSLTVLWDWISSLEKSGEVFVWPRLSYLPNLSLLFWKEYLWFLFCVHRDSDISYIKTSLISLWNITHQLGYYFLLNIFKQWFLKNSHAVLSCTRCYWNCWTCVRMYLSHPVNLIPYVIAVYIHLSHPPPKKSKKQKRNLPHNVSKCRLGPKCRVFAHRSLLLKFLFFILFCMYSLPCGGNRRFWVPPPPPTWSTHPTNVFFFISAMYAYVSMCGWVRELGLPVPKWVKSGGSENNLLGFPVGGPSWSSSLHV